MANLKRFTGSLCAVALVLWAASALPAQQVVFSGRYGPDVVRLFCLDDLFKIERALAPIIVGCELVDCCPGCPGPNPIDLRIQFNGGPFENIFFTFDSLSAGLQDSLQLEGDVAWVAPNRLRVGNGTAHIRGFDRGPDHPPIAFFPHILPDSVGPNELPVLDDNINNRVELTVDQMLGPDIVNDFGLSYDFESCTPVMQDGVYLYNNVALDEAVVFLDGRRSTGCVNDEVWRGDDVIFVNNVLSKDGCNSEVAVFSDFNAVAFIEDNGLAPTTWTDLSGDRFEVELLPRWEVPVSIWVASTRSDGEAAALADINKANELFNTNHVGLVFDTTDIKVRTLGSTCADLRYGGHYTPNQLNVYYLNEPGTGWSCALDRNVIKMMTGANNTTLAHEFGHAFSLRHANCTSTTTCPPPSGSVDYNGDGSPDLDATNVMWVAGSMGRTTFTEAQAFRMVLNPHSMLNANPIRTGPTRTCADAAVSVQCPWLGLDGIPN